MLRMNYWAVVVAAVAAYVVGAVWYSLLFGEAYLMLRGINPDAMTNMRPPAEEMLGEFIRCLVVAYVLARFVVRLGVFDWMGALRLGLWVWIGFQASLIVGSVIHENMPWKLYAIHAGDALMKTLFMVIILGVWHRRTSAAEQGA